jgi:hypothetical protein
VPFSVPPVTGRRRPFSTGIGSPVSSDSSTALRPAVTTPSIGTCRPAGRAGRRRRRPIPAAHPRSRRRPAPASRLRRAIEQRADGAAGSGAGAKLQHLAEEHQRDDHRRRLEVERDQAVVIAHRRRKDAGREDGDEAVEEGRAGAERDQREHVELRLTTDCQPRTKNGQPHHSTAGIASASCRYCPAAAQERQEIDAEDVLAMSSTRRKPASGTATRTGESCRSVRDWVPRRRSPPSAPAPCRRSGSFPARPARSPGASGRCRACPSARASPGRRSCRGCGPRLGSTPPANSARDRRRTSRGSPASRSDRSCRCGRRSACPSTDRRSCRRPGRWRFRQRRVGSRRRDAGSFRAPIICLYTIPL